MPSAAPIRFVVALGLACSASLLLAQSPASHPAATPQPSALPPTSPTTTPPAPPPLPPTPAQEPPKRAQITYADGTLSISADNSSLNQILHQVAQDTGIKITGGVTDERVFGQYGPAPTSQVLATLLDGTGSNMLLTHPEDNTPAELVLTPRRGGPTPPNPNAASASDDHSDPPQAIQPNIPTPVNTSSTPARPGSDTTFVPAATSPATPADTSAQPDSPNGVKTPQQIYDQLQRLRQQQQTPPQ